jgi:hypothetical protein
MPRATHVTVKRYREDRPVGWKGWKLLIDSVVAVGTTYRATLVSPDGKRTYPCPTHFRKPIGCYRWGEKEIRLLNGDAARGL